jgi:hypothetical protein
MQRLPGRCLAPHAQHPQAPHPHATHPHASHPHAPCDALRHALQANAERRLRDEDERLRQEAYEQRLAEAGADTTWERHRSQSELLQHMNRHEQPSRRSHQRRRDAASAAPPPGARKPPGRAPPPPNLTAGGGEVLLQEDRLELILSSGEPNHGHKAEVLAQYCNAFTERVLMRDVIVPPPLPNPTERIMGSAEWKQLTQGLSNSQLGRASPTHPEHSSAQATRPKSGGASRSARPTPPSSAGPSRIARRGSASSARRYVESAALVPRLATPTAWG